MPRGYPRRSRWGVAALAGAAAVVLPQSAPALGPPGCTTAHRTAPRLAGARPSFLRLPTTPGGIAASADGKRAFVALRTLTGHGSGIGVVALAPGRPRLVRVAVFPAAALPFGLALAPGGARLYVADSAGLSVFDTAKLLAGERPALVASVTDAGSGAVEVAVTHDGRHAFVSDEFSGEVSVFALPPRRPPRLLGSVRVPVGPVGLAVAPDDRHLYVASVGGLGRRPSGALSVIDVAKAIADPARAVVSGADAGCGAVRVALSPDGRIAWVTARGSDSLLAFDTRRLLSDPRRALRAVVRVGPAPVGIALLDGGARIAVADSNRFAGGRRPQALTIVDARAALAGRAAVLGTIAAGNFPRELAALPDGTILVANFGSQSLEAVPPLR